MDELLTSTEPLDDLDRSRLEDWLRVLQEDVELFGATGEDVTRMAAIRARLHRDDQERKARTP